MVVARAYFRLTECHSDWSTFGSCSFGMGSSFGSARISGFFFFVVFLSSGIYTLPDIVLRTTREDVGISLIHPRVVWGGYYYLPLWFNSVPIYRDSYVFYVLLKVSGS